MTKYRIIRETFASGKSLYQAQERSCFVFWTPLDWWHEGWTSFEDAQALIHEDKMNTVVQRKTVTEQK